MDCSMEGGGRGLPVMSGRTQVKQTARIALRVLHTPNVEGFVITQNVTIAIARMERSVAYDVVVSDDLSLGPAVYSTGAAELKPDTWYGHCHLKCPGPNRRRS